MCWTIIPAIRKVREKEKTELWSKGCGEAKLEGNKCRCERGSRVETASAKALEWASLAGSQK